MKHLYIFYIERLKTIFKKKIKHSTLKKRIKSNIDKKGFFFQSVLAFTIRSLGAFSAFLLNLVIARTLPPQQAGYYFLAYTVVQVLATSGQLGLHNSLLRFIGSSKAVENWHEASAAHKTSTVWVCLFSSSLAVLLYFASPWLAGHILEKPQAATVLQAMAPSVPLFALLTLNAHALQAVGDVIKSVTTLNILVQLLLAAALLIGLATTAQTTTAFYSLACLITMLISLLWWQRKPGIHWRGVEPFPTTTLWQSCIPLWWVAMMNQSVQWTGQLVSGAYVPSEELAILAVAQRTAMLTSFVLMAVNLVVAPKFAALYKQGKSEQLERIALKATKLMVLFALPIVGLMLIFPEWLMWLFGEQYRSGANLLRILALGQFVNVMTGSVGYLLSMSGHERDLRNVVFISGPMAIILALVLTPLYGVTGAAVATAIALASQNLLAVGMVKRRLGFNTLAIWHKPKAT